MNSGTGTDIHAVGACYYSIRMRTPQGYSKRLFRTSGSESWNTHRWLSQVFTTPLLWITHLPYPARPSLLLSPSWTGSLEEAGVWGRAPPVTGLSHYHSGPPCLCMIPLAITASLCLGPAPRYRHSRQHRQARLSRGPWHNGAGAPLCRRKPLDRRRGERRTASFNAFITSFSFPVCHIFPFSWKISLFELCVEMLPLMLSEYFA